MSTIKTTVNDGSVLEFIQSVGSERKKQDSLVLLELFKKITQLEPKLWGKSLIGFGSYHYKSERSRQEGDWPLTAFSPRKQSLTIYIMPGFAKYTDLLKKLGKHKTSVSCLYINTLADIDLAILETIIKDSVQEMKKTHKV